MYTFTEKRTINTDYCMYVHTYAPYYYAFIQALKTKSAIIEKMLKMKKPN